MTEPNALDEALAKISRYEAGADPTPGTVGAERSVGSWWHLLLNADPDRRAHLLGALILGFRDNATGKAAAQAERDALMVAGFINQNWG